MQKQQEQALLAAFRTMPEMDRLMLLALAKSCAFEEVNSKACLSLVVGLNPPSGQPLVGNSC
jgi:hypothetical protein